nr:MAG TPA: hypothetical protein [Caudoviricetes sp.]
MDFSWLYFASVMTVPFMPYTYGTPNLLLANATNSSPVINFPPLSQYMKKQGILPLPHSFRKQLSMRPNIFLDTLVLFQHFPHLFQCFIHPTGKRIKRNHCCHCRKPLHKQIINLTQFQLSGTAAQFFFRFGHSIQQPFLDFGNLFFSRQFKKAVQHKSCCRRYTYTTNEQVPVFHHKFHNIIHTSDLLIRPNFFLFYVVCFPVKSQFLRLFCFLKGLDAIGDDCTNDGGHHRHGQIFCYFNTT